MASTLFISWSGKESREIAETLHRWLPLIIGSIDLWMSSIDLRSGKRWSNEISTNLERSNFGIVIITPHNKLSPWLLFEAGALSKNIIDSRVVPYLVGLRVSELEGPLSQFQANPADRGGTYDLIKSINNSLEQPIDDKIIDKRFEAFWPRLEKKLDVIIQRNEGKDELNQDSEIINKNIAISKLQEELIIVKEMVKQFVSQSTTSEYFKSQVQMEQLDFSIKSLEGTYIDEADKSHLYIRIIEGKIIAPYCYQGNDTLDAEYFNWRKTGAYWLTRFRWFHKNIQGLALYKLENDKLVGSWWLDDEKSTKLSNLNSSNINEIEGGTYTVWKKYQLSNFPKWATSFFKKHGSH